MNQLNNWTEVDSYSFFLGGLMDELIVKFKNLSPFSKTIKGHCSAPECMLQKDWINSVLTIAAGDEGESGFWHWSEHQYTVHNVRL